MLFNSLAFVWFFATLFFMYYNIVPDRFRWALLLIASCYFYMAYVPAFILILFFLITVDYVMGRLIYEAVGKQRKIYLIISIVANLSTLFFFKYFNFFSSNISDIAHLIHWNYSPLILQFALPLGLSFHVFQSLSYVIEVYKGKQIPERKYGIYALYVMFFPQLVAGPIERPQHLLRQFHESHSFNATNIRRGLELMLWGFFKKLVVADRLAQVVDHVYLNSAGSDGFTLLVAALLFTYQIYCDFSGYSDIAVGSALVFGYDLTANFNRPFAARSIPEFWRRWHISLSSWLKDYLYYPLAFGGKSITKVRLYLSLFITFVLIGLWHGANWTYVIFGAIHGIASVLSNITEKWRKRIHMFFSLSSFPSLHALWQLCFTFILVSASFIFFRAESITQSFTIFSVIFKSAIHPVQTLIHIRYDISLINLGVPISKLVLLFFAIVVVEYIQFRQARDQTLFIFDKYPRIIRWMWYYFLILFILGFGYLKAQSFIYFKF